MHEHSRGVAAQGYQLLASQEALLEYAPTTSSPWVSINRRAINEEVRSHQSAMLAGIIAIRS
jgi:hypothetical protein